MKMRSTARESSLSVCMAVIGCALPLCAAAVYINPQFGITGGDGNAIPLLSPPVISVVDACAKSVQVESFIPKATVQIILNGGPVIGTATPQFGYGAVALSQALNAGDSLTARQIVNGLKSEPSSPPLIVGAMPSPLPTPTVDSRLYDCGHIVAVGALAPGVSVSVQDVSTGNTVLGNGTTPNEWGDDWAPVLTSALVAGHEVTAVQSACSVPASPFAVPQAVDADPSPVPPPQLDPPIVGNDALGLSGLYIGAGVQAFDSGVAFGGGGFATGPNNSVAVPPIAATASISVQQTLCTGSSITPPQTAVSVIPAPQLLAPICPGQPIVHARGTTVDATLVLLQNGKVVGNGGAAPGDVPISIAPPAAFADGDQVSLVEYIGPIVSPGSNVVTVNCAAQNVVTQHNNNARQGAQLAETILTPVTVKGPNFGLLYERAVLGNLMAQPLYVHGVRINNQVRNVIVVATAQDLVYAFDADDLSPDTSQTVIDFQGNAESESTKWLWRTALGTPDVSTICPETDPPYVGITSTPVIDVSAATVYVVARNQSPKQLRMGAAGNDVLHALDLTTGTVLRSQTVSAIDPTDNTIAFNTTCQRQRPGLLLQNGTVYLGFGTYNCDSRCSASEPFRGWIIGYRAADFAAAGVFTNSMSFDEGGMGVWASGNGLVGEPDGSIFYQTGNDVAPSLAMLGDSFVKLHGDGTSLTLAAHYRPAFASDYANGDTDLGSGGPMLIPGGPLVGGGKDGRFFVLSPVNLHPIEKDFQAYFNSFHFGPGPYPFNTAATPTYSTRCPAPILSGPGKDLTGVADFGVACYIDTAWYKDGEAFGPNIHGGPVFWRYSAKAGYVYKMSERDYLKAFEFDYASKTLKSTPAHVATVRPGQDGMPGGFSSVSAHGTADGIVWTVVQQLNSMYGPPTTAILYAHDGRTLKELWNNTPDAAAFAKFSSPTIADGRVILPSFNLFQVYGLSGPGITRHGIQNLPLETAIQRKWLNLGAAQGILGRPKGELYGDGTSGLHQDFETVLKGGGYGAISVPPSVRIEAGMCAPGMTHEPAVTLQASIYASRRTGVHYVIGEIRDRYLQAGGIKRFGYPVTDEVPTPDGLGMMTRFERGTVFWYPGHLAQVGTPKPPPPPRTASQKRK